MNKAQQLHQEAYAWELRETEAKQEAEEALKTYTDGQAVVQSVAQAMQEQAHIQITDVVNKCLKGIFEKPYEFAIRFERMRGKTEARMVFLRDGMEVDPTTASGGGVLDVAAFALRVASILLARPQRSKVLILDEPFRFLSNEYRSQVSDLLKTLSKELELQIIMVTHAKELEIGKVIEI